MARNKFISFFLLYPASLLFGAGVSVRNWMFNHGILSSEEFDVPVVTVGNIAVGGTGKTPHTEYIVNALKTKYRLAVLSRGYKRHSKGFVLADENSNLQDLGDESLQMFRKFGKDIKVAVCENRVEGIDRLLEIDNRINMVVLDDAFQHRYVKPSVSIVLTDFSRPVYEDKLLPFGKLREPMSAINRADIVVVTKCPSDLRPMDMRLVKQHLNLYPYQKLFFSTFEYCRPVALFPEMASKCPDLNLLTSDDVIVSLTGIENPRPFVKYLKSFKAKVKIKRYPDHHFFSQSDIESVLQKKDSTPGKCKIILTTEKDAMRLLSIADLPKELKESIYYIPVKVVIVDEGRNGSLESTILQLIKNKNL